MRRLQSRDNPQYRRIARVASSARERRNQGSILLDGPHLVDAYLSAFGTAGVTLIVREHAADDAETRALMARVDAEHSLTMTDRLFDALSPVDTPTGIMAVARRPDALPAIHPEGFTVLLDGIQDPGNLGAILRSAAAAGCREAYLTSACADPWSPRCLRGGMGAQFVLPIHTRQSLREVAQAFRGQVVAAAAAGESELFDVSLPAQCAFVIGAEGKGVSSELLACAGARVRIPMARGIESLNAASAATLLFYEWARRHRAHSAVCAPHT
ncbi:MAG: RNA methyltransferase [Burkholderiales bacterium]|nr:RNA methyltransferase [Burkholderiales bacterium]